VNWFKKAQDKARQYYSPIMVSSYIGNRMGILFDGRGPYYYIAENDQYQYIESLLNKKNYKKVGEILPSLKEYDPAFFSPKKSPQQQFPFMQN